jgi:hypothetical protein
LTVLLLAGCGQTAAVARHSASLHAAFTPPPWLRLVNDAFEHRRIEHRYSCAAAAAAVEHSRSDGYLYPTIHKYMLKVCWAQLHPARLIQAMT